MKQGVDGRNKPAMTENEMRYAIVIENAGGNYSAHVPDLPGCVATGESIQAVEREIGEAIRMHIHGLKEDGLSVPAPKTLK